MKVVVIGATGIIGRSIVSELSPRHEIIEVGKSRSALSVDVLDAASVQRLFAKIGTFDAVVTAVGNVHFGPLATMTPDEFRIGLNDKLMGQINVVLAARDLMADGGSFTLDERYPQRRADPGRSKRQHRQCGDRWICARRRDRAATRDAHQQREPDGARGNRGRHTGPTSAASSPYRQSGWPSAYSRSVEGAGTGQVYRVW